MYELDHISHHGVLGQKWGVRRYQNKDGSLTKLGIQRRRAINANKTKSQVDEIIDTLSDEDKRLLNIEKDETYLTEQQGEYVVKRLLMKHGDTPVAFLDFLRDGDNLNVAIATRSGEEYRGKGYASELTRRGNNWLEKHKELYDKVIWAAKSENQASRKLVEKAGYKFVNDDKKWAIYEKGAH